MGAAPVHQLSKTKSINPHKTLSKQHFKVRLQFTADNFNTHL